MGVSRQGRVQRPARTSGRLGDRRSSSHALRVSRAWLARHVRAGIAGADSRTGSRPVPGAPRPILPRCAGFTGGTRISWEPGGNSRGPPSGSWTKTRGPAPAGTALCGAASTPSRLRLARRRFLPRLARLHVIPRGAWASRCGVAEPLQHPPTACAMHRPNAHVVGDSSPAGTRIGSFHTPGYPFRPGHARPRRTTGVLREALPRRPRGARSRCSVSHTLCAFREARAHLVGDREHARTCVIAPCPQPGRSCLTRLARFTGRTLASWNTAACAEE